MINTLRARAIIDRFIAKADRVNRPLQQFYGSDAYSGMESALRDGIQKQAEAVAQSVRDGLVPNGLAPLTYAETTRLAGQVDGVMPQLSDVVDQGDITGALVAAFSSAVAAQYARWGIRLKTVVRGELAKDDGPVINGFQLTNKNYIAALNNQANYLLNKSMIDSTTLSRLVSLIADGKESLLTNDEIADQITGEFSEISDYRATMIARTEVAQAMSTGDLATLKENGIKTKAWVVAGPGGDLCDDNADDGQIAVDDVFSSGDDAPPAHPNCECYLEAGEIDLDDPDLTIWSGE
jgi:hypothetical protein